MHSILVIYALIGSTWTPTPLISLNRPVAAYDFGSEDVCRWAQQYIRDAVKGVRTADGKTPEFRSECVAGTDPIKTFSEV